MEKSDRIAELLALDSTGSLSEAEQAELEEWLKEDERHRRLQQELLSSENLISRYKAYREIDVIGLQRRFEQRTGLRSRLFWRQAVRVAAIVLLALGVGLSALYYSGEKQGGEQWAVNPILPGKAGSVLVLGDGRQVVLTPDDTAGIDLRGEALLTEKKDGLVYTGSARKDNEYNTLQVPRGGEFRVTLADGSFVHLNAASELRYPVAFTGDSRTVYLSGEAWFSVAKDSKRPFYVQTDQLRIKVYGTSFNVNTLEDSTTTVALVSGEVGLQAGTSGEYRLKPSDLARYHAGRGTVDIRQTDLTPYISWHEGLLVFEDESLERIMDRLAIWYDVEIYYADEGIRKQTFTGYLKRYDSIDVILKALQRTVSMHFILEGQKLTLMK